MVMKNGYQSDGKNNTVLSELVLDISQYSNIGILASEGFENTFFFFNSLTLCIHK